MWRLDWYSVLAGSRPDLVAAMRVASGLPGSGSSAWTGGREEPRPRGAGDAVVDHIVSPPMTPAPEAPSSVGPVAEPLRIECRHQTRRTRHARRLDAGPLPDIIPPSRCFLGGSFGLGHAVALAGIGTKKWRVDLGGEDETSRRKNRRRFQGHETSRPSRTRPDYHRGEALWRLLLIGVPESCMSPSLCDAKKQKGRRRIRVTKCVPSNHARPHLSPLFSSAPLGDGERGRTPGGSAHLQVRARVNSGREKRLVVQVMGADSEAAHQMSCRKRNKRRRAHGPGRTRNGGSPRRVSGAQRAL